MAILAMDAYNRVGNDVTDRNLNVSGSSLGDVDLYLAKGDNSSGFFAQSYVVKGPRARANRRSAVDPMVRGTRPMFTKVAGIEAQSTRTFRPDAYCVCKFSLATCARIHLAACD
jgi:hypothetical protein